MNSIAQFDIRQLTEFLTATKQKNRYHCPVCEGHNLTVNSRTGAYKCWNGCESKDIRKTLQPLWEEKMGIQQEVKRERKQGRTEYIYKDRAGIPLIRVVKLVPGYNGSDKSIYQQHWNGEKWVKGYGSISTEQIPLYRYSEVMEAIDRGETIVLCEGEGVADAFWKKGIPATTTIGGTGKTVNKDDKGNFWRNDETFKLIQPALSDLKEASVILAPDRDKPGCLHMEMMAEHLNVVGWLYALPNSIQWSRLPLKKGIDFVDWVCDYPSLKKTQILDAVVISPTHGAITENNNTDNGQFKITVNPNIQGNSDIKVTGQSLNEAIDELIKQDLPQSELKFQFIDLGKRSGIRSKEIESLYDTKRAEREKAEDLADRQEELKNLQQLKQVRVYLTEYLDPKLAQPLTRLCELMGWHEGAMMTTLLPVAASLLPLRTRLTLIEPSNFQAHPILYTGIVAESGSAKSPIQKQFTRPLYTLQSEAAFEYDLQLKDWKIASQSAQKEEDILPEPKRRDYLTTDSTPEAICQIQSDQPERGFLIYRDELDGFFEHGTYNKAGKREEVAKILSGRDGSGFKVDRANGKRLFVERCGYSITGAIQPDILRKRKGDLDDSQGYWARFLFCRMEKTPSPYPEDETALELDELLLNIYRNLDYQKPMTYKMSPEAKEKYKKWYNRLDDLSSTHPQQGMRAVFSKMKGITGELALILHCLNAAIAGVDPNPQVSLQTMKLAVRLAQFYIGQVKLIHAESLAEAGNDQVAILHLVQEKAEKAGRFVTSRDVFQMLSPKQRKTLSSAQIREAFTQLESNEIGTTKGEGAKIMFISKKVGDSEAVGCCRLLPYIPEKPYTEGNTEDFGKSVGRFVGCSVGCSESDFKAPQTIAQQQSDNISKNKCRSFSENLENKDRNTPDFVTELNENHVPVEQKSVTPPKTPSQNEGYDPTIRGFFNLLIGQARKNWLTILSQRSDIELQNLMDVACETLGLNIFKSHLETHFSEKTENWDRATVTRRMMRLKREEICLILYQCAQQLSGYRFEGRLDPSI